MAERIAMERPPGLSSRGIADRPHRPPHDWATTSLVSSGFAADAGFARVGSKRSGSEQEGAHRGNPVSPVPNLERRPTCHTLT